MPTGNSFAILKSASSKSKVLMVENFITINNPTNLVVDSNGNLIAAQSNILYKITQNGTITTFANIKNESGILVAPSSIGIDALNNIYTVQQFDAAIDAYYFMYKIDTSGNVSSYKKIGSNMAIVIDKSNNIYVVPRNSPTVAKHTLTTVVNYGNLPTSGSVLPDIRGLCLDSAENIYFSDIKYARIGKIKKDGSSWAWVATAGFVNPYRMCSDEFDNLYIVDNNSMVIKKLSPDKKVSIIAGTGATGDKIGVASLATFSVIGGIAYSNGVLYISDSRNNKIKKIIL